MIRAKNKERRENVICELLVTEHDFCRDLKLTWQAFGLDTPAMLEQRNVDVGSLFGNLSDIIEVSESFLDTLHSEVKNKSASEQIVGRCVRTKNSINIKKETKSYWVLRYLLCSM